jgi:hypothetical protein
LSSTELPRRAGNKRAKAGRVGHPQSRGQIRVFRDAFGVRRGVSGALAVDRDRRLQACREPRVCLAALRIAADE